MVLGLPIETFTTLHVVISLIGIVTGFIFLRQVTGNRPLDRWTDSFLAFTALTSITGFLFPLSGVTPAVLFGLISAVLLIVAALALYVFGVNGAWRPVFIVSAIAALYLNVFVAVVQAFQKVGSLRALAPTQTEWPFALVHLIVFAGFVGSGIAALRYFRPHAYAKAYSLTGS